MTGSRQSYNEEITCVPVSVSASKSYLELTVLIQKCLHPIVERRYLKVWLVSFLKLLCTPLFFLVMVHLYPQASTSLTGILRTQCQLMDHFSNVQLFFLMGAGDSMHHFSSQLFSRVSHSLAVSLSPSL